MLDTNTFGQRLKNHGFNFYSGVPCSFLKPLINYAIQAQKDSFVMASSEGDAVAICAGAHLGGKKSVLLCQNSGLANALNPLTSLNPTFKIPLLGFVSLRGEPGLGDQPQHEMMGKITKKMLDLIEIDSEILSNDIEKATEQIARANEYIEKNKSFFFIVKKNTLSSVDLPEKKWIKSTCRSDHLPRLPETKKPTRLEALQIISEKRKETLVLATTGITGRELYEIDDVENNFYMVGSMGCVSSIGLGLVLAQKKPVIAIDGDGALIMRLGALATNGFYGQIGMLHILLDNNAHDSTGGQKTVSEKVDFVTIAKAAGYKKTVFAKNLDEFEQCIKNWHENRELTFLYLQIDTGKKPGLGRPKVTPEEVKNRFEKFARQKDV